MKKVTLFLFLIFLTTFSFAQGEDIPADIKSAFDAKFPDANVLSYIATSDKHIIMFKHENRIHKARFGMDGSWKETMSVLSLTEAPQPVKDYLRSNYGDVDFSDLWKVDAAGETFLKVTSDNLAVFFDPSGAFQRTEDIADPDADLR